MPPSHLIGLKPLIAAQEFRIGKLPEVNKEGVNHSLSPYAVMCWLNSRQPMMLNYLDRASGIMGYVN